MEYPATQMFVNDDENEESEEENDTRSLSHSENNKIGELIIDSVSHPVHRGVNKVGRIDTCSILIDHNTISKEHAEIEAGTGLKSIFICDLGSLNKTRLNDAVLRPRRLYQLQDGDALRFGSVHAVFKSEEKKEENTNELECSSVCDNFVVPETPAAERIVQSTIIPATPDPSFYKSASDTSDSIIASTQEAVGRSNKSPQFFSPKKSTRKPDQIPMDLDESGQQDISGLETQTNFSMEESDEDNIFEMITQQSNINEDETQKFDVIYNSAVRNTTLEPQPDSINDMETQKLTVESTATLVQPSTTNDIKSKITSFEKVTAVGCNPVNSVHHQETQKFKPTIAQDDDDSETDEEGMFDDSGGGIANMFDAPTQLLEVPRKASKVSKVIEESDDDEERQEAEVSTKTLGQSVEESVLPQPKGACIEGQGAVLTAPLNDSIESKLNNMFDDVNESYDEEPTQMLTQHLERILDNTQIEKKEAGIEETAEGGKESENDDSGRDTPEFVMPRILSSQELFADLPAVHILGTSSAREKREGVNSPPSFPVSKKFNTTPKSKRTRKFASGNPEDLVQNQLKPIAEEDEPLTPVKRAKIVKEQIKSRRVEKKARKIVKGEIPLSESEMRVEEIPNGTESNQDTLRVTEKAGQSARGISEEQTASGKRKTRTEKIPGSTKVSQNTSRVTKKEKPKTLKAGDGEPATVKGNNKTTSKVTDEEQLVSVDQNRVQKRLPPKKRGVPTIPKSLPTTIATNLTLVATAATVAVALPTQGITTTRVSTQSKLQNEVVSSSPTNRRSPSRAMIITDSSEPESPTPSLSCNGNGSESRSKKSPRLDTIRASSRRKSQTNTKPTSIATSTPRRSRKIPLEFLPADSDGGLAVSPAKKARSSVPDAVPTTETSPKSAKVPSPPNASIPLLPKGRRTRSKKTSSRNTPDRLNLIAAMEANAKSDSPVQSSLESQEIQAIFNRVEKPSNIQKEVGICRSDIAGNDRGEETNDPIMPSRNFTGFAKPADKPEKRKRGRPRRADVIADDDREEKISSVDNKKSDDKTEAKTPRGKRAVKVSPKNISPVRDKRSPSTRNAEKENIVEKATPAKRAKRNVNRVKRQEEEEVQPSSLTSPLRRGRSSISTQIASSVKTTKHKVLFTGVNDARLIAIVQSLGGTVTEKPTDCTVLVTDKVRRTYKFLCAMAMAVPIVPVGWLTESESIGHFLDTADHVLQDPVEEAKFKFNLRRSLENAANHKLLEGYTVVLTPNTSPPPNAEMKGMIQACGGRALARPPPNWPEQSLIISRQEDIKNAKKFLSKAPSSVHVLSVEFILTGILRHELNFEEHKLNVI
ncbi:mediator of DNA damage checkpoint protein 1 [Athalia rosae]|uniref:mediator of DNA damage checkpoint protein 1 n=1 Tax=Athalia rosae TaxID=37344 RepID=UPI00203450C2|nr:mediator of DNA damage checkpoint protein 1 [Athalia rosae]